ncbi:hypothetical protein PIB30_052655 [Stylosanthes scabra]|uniref:Uncharacterized protein n=1 Tax=Stylosanthes scabra TaxID=79078 RepID=A0ABU6ZGZ6_9FABA|nr:hypothetical protein [Stylosanthes scabra]
MALQGRSRRQAREDAWGEQADEAKLEVQAGQVPQEEEDLHRLNRVWHIAKALTSHAESFIPQTQEHTGLDELFHMTPCPSAEFTSIVETFRMSRA